MGGDGRWRELGTGVWVRHHDALRLNCGVVVGDGEALVIDTRSHRGEGDELLEAVRDVTDAPVRHVVNTHAHFDHCFGNESFLPARIWGQRRCRDELVATGDEQRRVVAEAMPETADRLREVVILPPEELVDDTAVVDVGGRDVALHFLGRGHTDHDLVVNVDDCGVVFAGDLVEEGAPPAFDDAYPVEWPGTLERLVELCRGTVVPGHGEVVDAEFVMRQRSQLAGVAELCRAAAEEAIKEAEAIAESPFPEDVTRLALARVRATIVQEPR